MHRSLAPNVLESLSPTDLSAITKGAIHRRAEAGKCFFQQGDRMSSFYVMLEGRARIVESIADGTQVAFTYVGAGEVFGLCDQHRCAVYPYSAEAVEPSHALVWQLKELPALMKAHPLFATNLVCALTHRVRDLQMRLRDLATANVERRLAMELLRLSNEAGEFEADHVRIAIPLTGTALADLTGTTLFTVSRVLARWKEDGLVESYKRRLLLRSLTKIQAIARNGATDSVGAPEDLAGAERESWGEEAGADL